ncbi:poly(A) polymerase [Drosophila busckii]|uniref:poly(A) polymerase n=1 Tax=Drosophila busckii TaxID=30019 RepID=UPI00083F13A9|nr:poly(A) polymerase [Drosophila busckii]
MLLKSMGILFVAALCLSSELLLTAAAPTAAWNSEPSASFERPANPVYYKRYHRRRPVPNRDDLEMLELREVFYVRRPAPTTPKPIRRLSDEQFDLRIKCDFNPALPECWSLISSSSTTTTTPRATATTTSTTTSSSSSTTTSTTQLPILPEPEVEFESEPETSVSTQIDEENITEPQPTESSAELTTPHAENADNDDIELPEDDGTDEQDLEDTYGVDTVTDATELVDEYDYSNQGGSIGGIDLS